MLLILKTDCQHKDLDAFGDYLLSFFHYEKQK